MAISPLLVWSEGEPLESAVSNLPWFMVCLFHETRKKKERGGGGGECCACDTCKQAWRWVLLLWIDSLLLRLLWWTMRSLRLRDQLLFHGLVVFKRKRKKKIFGQNSLKNHKMSAKLYFPAQRSLFHIWNSISGFGGCKDKRATWERLDLAAETQTICAHAAVLQFHKRRKSLAASIIHPETSGKL